MTEKEEGKCTNNICDYCKIESTKLFRCSKCRSVYYCSRKCQKKHWKVSHRLTCSISPDRNETSPPSAAEELINRKNNEKEKEMMLAWQDTMEELSKVSFSEARENLFCVENKLIPDTLKEEEEKANEMKQRKTNVRQSIPKKDQNVLNKQLSLFSEGEEYQESFIDSSRNNNLQKLIQSPKITKTSATALTEDNYTNYNHDKRSILPKSSNATFGRQELQPSYSQSQSKQHGNYTIEYLANISCYIITFIPSFGKNNLFSPSDKKKEKISSFPASTTTTTKLTDLYNKEDMNLIIHENTNGYDIMNNNNDLFLHIQLNHSHQTWMDICLPTKRKRRNQQNEERLYNDYNNSDHNTKNYNQLLYILEDCIYIRIPTKVNDITNHDSLSSLSDIESGSEMNPYIYTHLLSTLSSSQEFHQQYKQQQLKYLEEINQLQCRSCNFNLIQNYLNKNTTDGGEEEHQQVISTTNNNIKSDTKINRILPLPTGYWNEIADYIMCGKPNSAELLNQTIFFENPLNSSDNNKTIQQGLVLEDGNVLVIQSDDLIQESVMFIPHVEHYGGRSINENEVQEEDGDGLEYRGVRSWKDRDEISSLIMNSTKTTCTICCAQCCSILGFSPGSPFSKQVKNTKEQKLKSINIRLYKHRLTCNVNNFFDQQNRQDQENNSQNFDNMDTGAGNMASTLSFPPPVTLLPTLQFHTIGSFIAKEMIRYAQSQAVFKFIVFDHDSNNKKNNLSLSTMKRKTPAIKLKLLSWDTKMTSNHGDLYQKQKSCFSYLSSPHNGDERNSNIPMFSNVLKVIFEEIEYDGNNDSKKNHHQTTDNNDINDISNLSWTFDFCCLPDNNDNTDQNNIHHQPQSSSSSNASVGLYLQSDEFNELRQILFHGYNYFNKSTHQAQLLMNKKRKMANSANGSNGLLAGLSVLQFLQE